MTIEYTQFLKTKMARPTYSGFEVSPDAINPMAFKFQKDITLWALALGKAAIFAECGLGKTEIFLDWSKHVAAHTDGKVIILSPLAVAHQTVNEGIKFGVPIVYCKEQSEIGDHSIIITNYERIDKFDMSEFSGVVLDESSVLKAFTGKTKMAIIESFTHTPYKLACTATPAPNDHEELGNHAAFLGVMPRAEMLTRWFIHDSAKTQDWRLKKHGASDFWRWLTSWAVCLSKPGDLGMQYEMSEFELPELNIQQYHINANEAAYERANSQGRLFPDVNPSSTKLHKVKRESLVDRVAMARKIFNDIPLNEQVSIWCDTNYEADALKKMFPEAIEVRGSHKLEEKEKRLNAFTTGAARVIISKPSIAGFGLNWQHHHEMIFVGVSYSFEKLYQALRRSHRFGQTQTVNAHIIYAETEGNVIVRLEDKQAKFVEMQAEMNKAMHENGLFRDDPKLTLIDAENDIESGDNWTMLLGDCVTVAKTIDDNSIDFCIHSPPFSNLFVYSDNEADMGNSSNDDEFFAHYEYLIDELYRITAPGRLCAVHCSDIPTFKGRDGFIGIKDFPGDVIKSFIAKGWVYHSRVTIWKNPVVEMQRTKAKGLLHKQFKKDSAAVRVGMPDYMLIFTKPGDNPEPVTQSRQEGDYIGESPPTRIEIDGTDRNGNISPDSYSIALWQRYASPVWFDIEQGNVLNKRLARGEKDEKHIAPLQLDVIARCVDLWTNPGDVVFSPFAGIGSEGYESIRLGRKFIGIELKRSYFKYAVKYLKEAESKSKEIDLFQFAGIEFDDE